MTVHVESELGYTADFPEFTFPLENSSAGEGTEQFGLPGNILLTVLKDQGVVQSEPGLSGWANLIAGYYLEQHEGAVIAEGDLKLQDRATYAVMVRFVDSSGSSNVVSLVGILDGGKFLGLNVLWPDTDAEAEPRTELLKESIESIRAR